MISVKNIIQLKSLTTYTTVYLERIFDSSTTNSGGIFVWSPDSNADEIPGIIIKPDTQAPLAAAGKGRWIRSYSGSLNVDWFGAGNSSLTMQASGILQNDADIIYGAGFCNVTTDTLDTVAINAAFNQMYYGYFGICFSSVTYYINKELTVPKIYINGFSDQYRFIIEGNGAFIKTINNSSYTILSRHTAASMIEAITMQNCSLSVMNLKLQGMGLQKGILIGPSYTTNIENIAIESCKRAIDAKFCLGATIDRVEIINCNDSVGVILVDIDPAGSYLSSNAPSNHTLITKCRLFTGSTTSVAITVLGSSGVTVEECIVEGPDWKTAVYFDSKDAPTVKYFNCRNMHIELSSPDTVNSNTNPAIYVRPIGEGPGGLGEISIDSIFGQTGKLLLTVEPVHRCFIKLSNINHWLKSPNSKYIKVIKNNTGDSIHINIDNSPAFPRDMDRNINHWALNNPADLPLPYTEVFDESPPGFNGIMDWHIVRDVLTDNYYRFIASNSTWQQITFAGAQANAKSTIMLNQRHDHVPMQSP